MASNQLIDLTKPINNSLEIFSDGEYHDPDLVIQDWCTVEQQGYWSSSLQLGTQTGTHIDAPAHFVEGGETLEALDIANLMGPYFYLLADDLLDEQKCQQLLNGYQNEQILFLHGLTEVVSIPEVALLALLALNCPVWVSSIGLRVDGKEPLLFHSLLAQQGKYLVEDLAYSEATQVRPHGYVCALPLRLEGVSGAPCRVIVQNR